MRRLMRPTSAGGAVKGAELSLADCCKRRPSETLPCPLIGPLAPPPLPRYRVKPYCDPFPQGERVCCNAPLEVGERAKGAEQTSSRLG
jgi:hypothetical protein